MVAQTAEPKQQLQTVPEFPTAEKIDPIYKIENRLYRKVTNADGQSDPKAIRALVPLTKADGSGATSRLGWFIAIELPAPAEIAGAFLGDSAA